jgi:hypothetical protein
MENQVKRTDSVSAVSEDTVRQQIAHTYAISKQFKVYPYGEVKRVLDNLAIITAKNAAKEFAELFEKWEASE